MNFELDGDQQQLADLVRRYVAAQYSFEQRRTTLHSEDGWSRKVWAGLADLGLLGLHVPQEHGGLDGAGPDAGGGLALSPHAAVETMLAMTAFGRVLLLEPYLASAVIATRLVRALGSAAQRHALLPAMASGARIVVPAHGEADARYDLSLVTTSARPSGDAGGYVLSGRKAVVLHAPAADQLLVSARTSGEATDESGISLFLVDRRAPGLVLRPYRTLDGLTAADAAFDVVRVVPSDRLGVEGGAFAALVAAWDLGAAALCAEAVGALEAILGATVEYAKTRKQFGVVIGSFQSLQHRMADMLADLEQARSMSYLACLRASHPDPFVRTRAVSAAKFLVGRACRRVGQEAVQLHGGIGMTAELSVSHYFKRLAAIELTLGDSEHHLERFMWSSSQMQEST